MAAHIRDSIWSIAARFRVMYAVLFLGSYGVGFFLYVDRSYLLRDLAALGVASAALSFAATECVELLLMIYEALRELKERRQAAKIEEATKKAVEKERERLRKAGIEVPLPDDEPKEVSPSTC